MKNKQELFADIVKKHTTHADFVRTFSWGTLNFTTSTIDLNGSSHLQKIYSDIVDLMDGFDMMTYAMPVVYTKVSQKETNASYRISTINGWEFK